MTAKDNREVLKLAVRYLRHKDIIINEVKDIAEKTGYAKATVSNYVNGNLIPSPAFIEKFEKTFGLRLKDFEAGGQKEIIQHPDALQLLSENILLLKAEHQTNRQLIIEVLSAVTHRPVSEVELMAEKLLSHNLEKIVSELKQDTL